MMQVGLSRAGIEAQQPQAALQAGLRFGASHPTEFKMIEQGELWEQAADVLIVPVTERPSGGLPRGLTMLDGKTSGALAQVVSEQGFQGRPGQLVTLRKHPSDGIQARNVLLVGVGDYKKLNAEKIETAVSKALSRPELKSAKSAVLAVPEESPYLTTRTTVEALVGAVNRATYQSRQAHKPGLKIEEAGIFLPPDQRTQEKFRFDAVKKEQRVEQVPSLSYRTGELGIKRARAIGEGLGYARDIANSPYNRLRTQDLAREVAQFAEQYPTLKADIKNANWIKKNMPAFYAVGGASAKVDQPRWIKVTYTPPSGRVNRKVAVVGKAIMFDTGGVQAKGDHMNNMSKDKTGGAYALGLMKALAELKPDNVQVTVYLPATPNLQGPEANLPDNILDSSSGKRINVLHTDAEGRLALIDAVWQAANDKEAGKPDEIITLATLTGAAMRAVGDHVALITRPEDKKLQEAILHVARQQGEHFDTLPVCEDDFEAIKDPGDAADIRNSGAGSTRGAQKAGAFVMNGLPEGSDIPLAHWDIAGVMGEGPEWLGPATGKGFKTLVHYILKRSLDR